MGATLSAREGYQRWAPRYNAETVVSALDNHLVSQMHGSLAGLRLLDAGCGTARRLQTSDAAYATGVDASVAMLQQTHDIAINHTLAAADVRALPFAVESFDVVWCRLVLGHIAAIDRAYQELARVCVSGGTVVVTDFHADAVAAGHKRTFRNADATVHEIEHYVHSADQHRQAAERAGLTFGHQLEGSVSPLVRDFYKAADRLDVYNAQLGLHLVLALSFRREEHA